MKKESVVKEIELIIKGAEYCRDNYPTESDWSKGYDAGWIGALKQVYKMLTDKEYED